ncbi:U4/U6.U5 small nuclear ribonucleoprotein 27 kDa protein [Trichinella britovi]|uniref:U4/U6.U5 small nuclear ribonucleoprotein 27 kDa protein n=1 Tax=Trichinella britovi TaxID=45882 RepID=A0A0V1CT98_TRIBR|nr:U4/U6.U5 small nuclear ribonucleoprotein 27 kDa protein [Trichinella sp. T9]KRY52376.1 U4/U6.U5 small nuclear ribonucleoprotein 27 kDa protein [Trichinella britovi]
MARSRSRDRDGRRSRAYHRRRSRSPRERSRSRSRHDRKRRHRTRSSERHEKRDRRDHREKERKKNDSTNLELGSDDQAAMKEILGFSSFDTTKGKKVENNCTGDAHIHKKRKYRQYMNRRGGFNRPLDPVT